MAQEKPGAGASPAGLLTGRGPPSHVRAGHAGKQMPQVGKRHNWPLLQHTRPSLCPLHGAGSVRGASPNNQLFQTHLFQEPPNEHTLTPATLPQFIPCLPAV